MTLDSLQYVVYDCPSEGDRQFTQVHSQISRRNQSAHPLQAT
jgi:hypothetical protein